MRIKKENLEQRQSSTNNKVLINRFKGLPKIKKNSIYSQGLSLTVQHYFFAAFSQNHII